MENKDSFEYTYSAPEQDEVRAIREKYLPRDDRENKLEQLRKLDASVTRKGTMLSIILGTISCLIMGMGMSFRMSFEGMMIPGIVIGVIGMVGVALAYPLYQYLVKKEKERLGPEILKLTEELMDE